MNAHGANARKTAIAVFARFDSRRLSGKALRLIAGRSLLGRVLDRVCRVPGAQLIVATSDRAVDDPIARFAEAEGVSVFRGSAEDVAGRALACSEHLEVDCLVRISGDSPFIPPELIAKMIGHQACGFDALVTNTFPRTFPPGASIEVMGRGFLRAMLNQPLDAEDREHVTRYAYRNPECLKIVNVRAPDDRYAGVVLTVDTAEDLARAEAITLALGPRAATADLETVVATARAIRY